MSCILLSHFLMEYGQYRFSSHISQICTGSNMFRYRFMWRNLQVNFPSTNPAHCTLYGAQKNLTVMINCTTYYYIKSLTLGFSITPPCRRRIQIKTQRNIIKWYRKKYLSIQKLHRKYILISRNIEYCFNNENIPILKSSTHISIVTDIFIF